jgi:hypothetical protein
VYIPTISKVHTKEIIANYFALNCVGKVERVDFVEHPNDTNNQYQKAFVHFSSDRKTDEVWEAIEQKGSYRFYPCERLINICSFKEQTEYWILLKNRNPVPKTELNIDQIAHNQKLMEERSAQMEEREALMEQKMAQMEEREALMEERNTRMKERYAIMEQKMEQMEERYAKKEQKMDEQFKALIYLNENVCKVVDVQTANIQMLSKISEKVEETVKTSSDDKCRICNDAYVFGNESICGNCWDTCEPAEIPLTKEGLQTINQKLVFLKKDVDDKYWQLHDKIEEQAHDIKTLFERTWLDIEKLLEKAEKNKVSTEGLNEDSYYLKRQYMKTDDKVERIIGVVQDLVEQVSDKAMADFKTEIMRFGVTHSNLCKMTIDELM